MGQDRQQSQRIAGTGCAGADEGGDNGVVQGDEAGPGAKYENRREGRGVVGGVAEGAEIPVFIEDIDILNSKRIWS